ncbi:MAG: glycoside hydrolase family protein, partial [Planctomycetota bacterium]
IGGYKTFVCHFSSNEGAVWPVTDWRLDKVLAGGSSLGAYESKVYSDASGMYLIYDETLDDGDNHIMAQRMLEPDQIDTSFTARAILSPEGLNSEYRNGTSGMQIVEGANIKHVVTPNGSKYVMFYSVGDYALGNYKLGVAYSDVLIPPEGQQYLKPKVYDDKNYWSNSPAKDEVVYTLQTQVPNWYNYAAEFFKGPGLGNLVEYLGNYYIVFHAHDAAEVSTGRWVWVSEVTIDFSKGMESWVVPQLPLIRSQE